MSFLTKDSGQRQEFDTGSRRDTREGKGRYDLLPFFGLRRVAGLYERGAVKYGDRNWEKGQPLSRYIDSGLRHAFQAAAGYTDEDHLAAVVWNFLAIIDHQERIARGELPQELDDLPTPAFPTPDEDLFTQTDDVLDAAAERQAFPLHLRFPAVSVDFVVDERVSPEVMHLLSGGKITTISTGERPYGGGAAYSDSDLVGHNHD